MVKVIQSLTTRMRLLGTANLRGRPSLGGSSAPPAKALRPLQVDVLLSSVDLSLAAHVFAGPLVLDRAVPAHAGRSKISCSSRLMPPLSRFRFARSRSRLFRRESLDDSELVLELELELELGPAMTALRQSRKASEVASQARGVIARGRKSVFLLFGCVKWL